VWNTLLALVPPAVAVVLFRRDRRAEGIAWWTGLGLFFVMLPNAPYVLTDVVHLIHSAHHGLLLREAVAYTVFFAVGTLAYTVSVARLMGFLRDRGLPPVPRAVTEVALHTAVAVGVLIGRYARFNSWDLGLRPGRVVLDSLGWASPRALVAIVLLAGGLAVVTTTLRCAAHGARLGLGGRAARA
jgi:uncharacterized membrane protein